MTHAMTVTVTVRQQEQTHAMLVKKLASDVSGGDDVDAEIRSAVYQHQGRDTATVGVTAKGWLQDGSALNSRCRPGLESLLFLA